MDALAVAICKGLALRKWKFRNAVIVGLWFGGFQALMPVFGYILGSQFAGRIQKIDHWIAFVLLTLIGANMIREALGENKNEESEEAPCETDSLSFKSMLLLAIATSIDALAVGVTFAFLKVTLSWQHPLSELRPSLFLLSEFTLGADLEQSLNPKQNFLVVLY